MGRKTSINCDYCGKDITYNETNFPHQYNLTLDVRDAPWPPEKKYGAVNDILMRRPKTPGTDFCDIKCLKEALLQSAKS